jgi:hypothetical protein
MPASKESPAARYRELAETVSELRAAVSELRARVAELARRAAPAPAPAGRDPFPAGFQPPPPPAPSPFAEDHPAYLAAMISSNPAAGLPAALREIAADEAVHRSARADAAAAAELIESRRSAPYDAVEDARQARLATAREQARGELSAPMGTYRPEGAKAPVQQSRPFPGAPAGPQAEGPQEEDRWRQVREQALAQAIMLREGGAPGAA